MCPFCIFAAILSQKSGISPKNHDFQCGNRDFHLEIENSNWKLPFTAWKLRFPLGNREFYLEIAIYSVEITNFIWKSGMPSGNCDFQSKIAVQISIG